MAGALVVGLGRSGAGAARLLDMMGEQVTVTDARTEDALRDYVLSLPPRVNLLLGGHPEWAFREAGLIVVSPGVPMDIPPMRAALEAGVPVIGELELAHRALRGVPCYAVTGTNGKSTTTTLLHLMLIKEGRRCLLAGNIGNALTSEIASLGIDGLRSLECVALEVSSFQLETIAEFRPRVSSILNITPDHLDRYHGMEGYAAAKARIFMNQRAGDALVLNAEDPGTIELYESMKSAINCDTYFFSRVREVRGVYMDGDVMRYDIPAIGRGELIRASEIAIKGLHNLENAMAASLMAMLAGVAPENAASVLREFQGLEHRMEFVRELDGVRYINDSKGTNVDAAIKSVGSFSEPVVLIAGGRDKAGDFDAFAQAISDKLKAIVLIGEAASKIHKAFEGKVKCVNASTLKDAIEKSRAMAQKGDVVLLSPACASFDMFRDYEDRGRQFKRLVAEL